ncbi:MAG: hypothetical protein HOP28_09050 [Gemmatimonadales bacterium]|nr:hypothetical protein [Gemmatimonadales bacterium]
MVKKRVDRVREPVQVYLDVQDATMLAGLVEQTGLAKAELLRRGLRQLAQQLVDKSRPGWSFDLLVGAIDDPDGPTDMSERHDEYLAEILEERIRRGARPD